MAAKAYRVQFTCAHQVIVNFISDNADAKVWFAIQVNDARSRARGAGVPTGHPDLLIFQDMFGNTVAVDPTQVIAVLVQPLDEEELRAVRHRLGEGSDISIRT